MTNPTKSLNELVKIFNSALFNDNIEFVRVRKDFIDALIEDRQLLLDYINKNRGFKQGVGEMVCTCLWDYEADKPLETKGCKIHENR